MKPTIIVTCLLALVGCGKQQGEATSQPVGSSNSQGRAASTPSGGKLQSAEDPVKSFKPYAEKVLAAVHKMAPEWSFVLKDFDVVKTASLRKPYTGTYEVFGTYNSRNTEARGYLTFDFEYRDGRWWPVNDVTKHRLGPGNSDIGAASHWEFGVIVVSSKLLLIEIAQQKGMFPPPQSTARS